MLLIGAIKGSWLKMLTDKGWEQILAEIVKDRAELIKLGQFGINL